MSNTNDEHELPTVSDELIATRAAEIIASLPPKRDYVMPHPDKKGHERVIEPCDRCGGPGHINAFRHVLGGVCFKCGGAGANHTVLVSSVRQRERSRVKKHNAAIDKAIATAHEVARRELETLAHDQAVERALANAAMLNRERAERAAQGLVQIYPINTRVKNLNVTVTDAYSFDREAHGPSGGLESVAAVIFTTDAGHELVWYSTGAKAHQLKKDYQQGKTPLALAINAKAKRYQERDDGTARLVITHVTARDLRPEPHLPPQA